jgi:hypothetical protein
MYAYKYPGLKGQGHEVFDFRFPQSPLVSHKGQFKFFWKYAEKCTAQGAPPCQRQMEKIFNQKSFKYLVWTPLGSRVNISNSCHQCRWHRWQIVPLVSLTPLANLHRWYWCCTLILEYLREFCKKIWNDPNVIFRGLGEDVKKTWSKISSVTVPLKMHTMCVMDAHVILLQRFKSFLKKMTCLSYLCSWCSTVHWEESEDPGGNWTNLCWIGDPP